MGRQLSLSDALHQHIHNRDAQALAEFLRSHESELNSNTLDEVIFIQLIRGHWDCGTIDFFAKLADDHQLALMVACAVLQDHAVPLGPLFDRMRDPQKTIEKHQLKHLFLAACERENVDAVRAFIQNRCFDPSDRRPIRAVVRAQLKKAVANEELLKMVLAAHPLQTDNVDYLRKNCLPDANNDGVRQMVDDLLFSYIP